MKNIIYCNPLPLPDYPRGRSPITEKEKAHTGMWLQEERRDFLETVDSNAIYTVFGVRRLATVS